MESSDVLNFLVNLSNDQRLVTRAIASCKAALKTYSEEEIELGRLPLNGYELDEVSFKLEKMMLVYTHDKLDSPFIETHIGLYIDAPGMVHFGGVDQIGRYQMMTTLDGNIEDEDLDIDEIAWDVQLLPIAFEMKPFVSEKARCQFLDRFIQEAIEDNGLLFGGGGSGQVWDGFVEPDIPLVISNAQVTAVKLWIEQQPEILRFHIGPVMSDVEVGKKRRREADFPSLAS